MCMARLSLSLSLSLSHTHTHTHMASGAWGHYFWCDVQQLEHAGVLYSSTGTAADQRKACVCVLQFMICTVRRLWIYYLIIIFQYFHLFNLHNILLLHFQRFSYVCVCVVCCRWELLYLNGKGIVFRLSGLFEFESNSGIVETRVDRAGKKEGKAGGGGCGVVSLESGRGETRAREGPDCQSIVIIMWVNCN